MQNCTVYCRASVPVQWQEQQAICIAGLTKPKPNVFQQAVHYLMVVCTTVEVPCLELVSCCCLHPLATSSALSVMTTVTCALLLDRRAPVSHIQHSACLLALTAAAITH